MEALYFICPGVFFLLTIALSFCINPKIASRINVTIGKINSQDIIKMTSNQRSYLQRKVSIYFSTAFIVVLIISIVFYVSFHSKNSMLSILVCNIICTVVGLVIALSVMKPANELKKKLDAQCL